MIRAPHLGPAQCKENHHRYNASKHVRFAQAMSRRAAGHGSAATNYIPPHPIVKNPRPGEGVPTHALQGSAHYAGPTRCQRGCRTTPDAMPKRARGRTPTRPARRLTPPPDRPAPDVRTKCERHMFSSYRIYEPRVTLCMDCRYPEHMHNPSVPGLRERCCADHHSRARSRSPR